MKLAKRIKQSIKQVTASAVVELGNLRNLHVEDGNPFSFMGVEAPLHWIEKGHTPQFALYTWGQHFVSAFMEEVTSHFRETEDFRKKFTAAEDEYLPSGPPMSPLTQSFFLYWASFDLRFGRHSETMGQVLVDLFTASEVSGWPKQVLEKMTPSRMGVYEHIGFDSDRLLLREFVTGKTFSCTCTAGYGGEKREIWLTRLLPPILDSDPWMIPLTPYIIRYPKDRWDAYFERTLFQMGQPGLEESYEKLMKQGLSPYYWHEYIFLAYSNFQTDAIFLTGVPDDPSSLPHAKQEED